MKQCLKCKQDKSLECFGNKATSRDRLQPYCKECQKAASRDWYAKNTERRSRIAKEWRDANPRKVTGYDFKAKYGITMDEYEKMLFDQNGVCKICKKPCGLRKRLSVDHDHAAERVRGLLCDRCNRGIGLFFDDVSILKAAIIYLNDKP